MTTARSQRQQATGASPRMAREERRRQLVEHAKQLFVTLGYHDTTTEKIARAAGVTEPVLYRHFQSKKVLFLEVLHEIRQATLDRWQAEADSNIDPLTLLRRIVDHYLDTSREHALEYRIMHRTLIETGDEEIAEVLRQFYLENEELLGRIIRSGQQSGQFRSELDPRVGAWELIHAALGYTLTLPLGISTYTEPNYLPQAIDCLLRCLQKNS